MMNIIHLLSFEFTHFTRDKSKVLSYLLFAFSCFYAILNGFDLQNKQKTTIENIQLEQQKECVRGQEQEEGAGGNV